MSRGKRRTPGADALKLEKMNFLVLQIIINYLIYELLRNEELSFPNELFHY